MNNDSYILIVGAVFQEIKPLVEKLNSAQKKSMGNRQIFCGKLFDQTVIIAESGIGMLNAAQTVTVVIERMPVHLIINTGCAGIFPDAGITIGDIGIATQEIDIHSGIEGAYPSAPVKQLPMPLIQTEMNTYYGTYPLSSYHSQLAYDILSKEFESQNIRVKMVPFITVSTITSSEQRSNCLFNSYQCGMENMEGAGIAHVAVLYNKPFLEIRAASNVVGIRDKQKWDFTLAFERSSIAILQLMASL